MKPRFFPTAVRFRRWLEQHHASAPDLLVGFYKTGSGRPSMTWPESVDEALCFGWIDGVRRRIDDEAYSIRFSPRRPTSIWSAVNVAKVAALTKAGRMTPAGERAYAARTPERTGTYAFERTSAAQFAPEHEKKLRANRKAAAFFDAQAPWYRRTVTHWVVSAKRPETREKRLAQLIADSAAGRRIGPLQKAQSAPGQGDP